MPHADFLLVARSDQLRIDEEQIIDRSTEGERADDRVNRCVNQIPEANVRSHCDGKKFGFSKVG